MGFTGLFTVISLLTQTWMNAAMLGVLFLGFFSGRVLIQRGFHRSAMHVIVGVMLAYQLAVLALYRDTPSIGLIWFLIVPSIVASMGTPKDILFWTPFCIVAMLISYSFVLDEPLMTHPMTLPNLIGTISFLAIVSYRFVSERKFREQQLTDAVDLANAAEQRSNRLLASLSHELRSPMTGILLSSEMLKDSADLNEDDRASLERLNTSALVTTNLLNDVLELAKVEAGVVALDRSRFKLEPLLEEIKMTFLSLAQINGNQLHILLPPDCPANWDSSAVCIRKILSNLIGNGLKYTENGHVIVTFDVGASFLDVRVRDTGLGILESQQAQLFDPFISLAEMSSNDTGLGLTLARGYSQWLGSELDLVRSEEGKGSEFRLRIPAAEYGVGNIGDDYPGTDDSVRTAALAFDTLVADLWGQSWLDHWGIALDSNSDTAIDQSVGDVSTLAEALKVRVQRVKPTIQHQTETETETETETIDPMANDLSPRGLVCDDNDLIREVFSQQLTRLGYVNEATRDMQETQDRLNAENFQFLLLDVQLGGESGIDVLKRIRHSDKPYADIPICMISGSLMEKDEALALGADNFLLKPPLSGELAEMALLLSKMARERETQKTL